MIQLVAFLGNYGNEYAKKLCVEVGKPDIPIYIAGHRNHIDLQDYMDDEYDDEYDEYEEYEEYEEGIEE